MEWTPYHMQENRPLMLFVVLMEQPVLIFLQLNQRMHLLYHCAGVQ